MSNQPEHPTLLIPGPIEFDDDVLQSMSHYSESHVGAAFVSLFGDTLSMLRKLLLTADPLSQPLIVSGSGTLGWDMVAANLVERGDEVLVLHTGYFADSFADCFETYGIVATQLKAPIGDRPQLPDVEKALKEKKYKLLTITHVDTSTGVLSDIKALSELVHRVSPETLVVVDGVCSVGSEEIQFDEWGIDVVLTASQKAIGCPAGLCIMMCSGRAIERFENRKTHPGSYFASFKNWLPIMKNYEAKKPSYFATPAPQLIHALNTALAQILARPISERFAAHREASQRIKSTVNSLGLEQLASKPENQANGMTAMYLPEGIKGPEILPSLLKKGVIFAGGLHKEIAPRYIRFGHMGVSVMDPTRGDIERALEALKSGLAEVGYKHAEILVITAHSEIELHSMGDDEEEAVIAPLINHENQVNSGGEYQTQESDSTSPSAFVWALTLTACISGLLFGYDTGVISSTLVSIGTDLSYPLTTLDKSLITSCTSLFALLASPIASVLADKLGRKRVILVADILFIVGALWQAASTSVPGMIVGRSIVGLAVGGASLVVPLYISELSPSAFRGSLVTLNVLFVTAGQVVSYIFGWRLSLKQHGWRWMVGLGAAPAILQFGLVLFLPETPRWLMKNGDMQHAQNVLRKVYAQSNSVVEEVIRAIDNEISEEDAAGKRISISERSRSSWLNKLRNASTDLFCIGGNRRALIIACMLQGLQQLCGFNSLMYFSATMFSAIGFSSPTLTSLSIAVTNFICTLIALAIIDRIGRRRILLCTIPIMVGGLLLCSVSYQYLELPKDHHGSVGFPAILILIALIIYVCGYAIGLGNIAWQQSELFPLSVRSLGSGLATATNWGSNFIVGLTFLPMMEYLSPTWTFFIYAMICTIGWAFARKIYPETKGLRLEDIRGLLRDGWGVKRAG